MAFKINEPIVCIFYGVWLEIKPDREIAVPGPKFNEVVHVTGFANDGGIFLREYPSILEGYSPSSFRHMNAREKAEYLVNKQLRPLTLIPQKQKA